MTTAATLHRSQGLALPWGGELNSMTNCSIGYRQCILMMDNMPGNKLNRPEKMSLLLFLSALQPFFSFPDAEINILSLHVTLVIADQLNPSVSSVAEIRLALQSRPECVSIWKHSVILCKVIFKSFALYCTSLSASASSPASASRVLLFIICTRQY